MIKKQNLAIPEELNEIELEIASYLINSDELIFEHLGDNGNIEPLHIHELENINLLQRINSPMEFSQNNSGFW